MPTENKSVIYVLISRHQSPVKFSRSQFNYSFVFILLSFYFRTNVLLLVETHVTIPCFPHWQKKSRRWVRRWNFSVSIARWNIAGIKNHTFNYSEHCFNTVGSDRMLFCFHSSSRFQNLFRKSDKPTSYQSNSRPFFKFLFLFLSLARDPKRYYPIKSWQKPETSLEKSLTPRVKRYWDFRKTDPSYHIARERTFSLTWPATV